MYAPLAEAAYLRPIGLPAAARPGILAVFLTNGLLHEYLFLPVDLTVLGWQLPSFSPTASEPFCRGDRAWIRTNHRPPPAPRPLAIMATAAFVLLTAPVFIHSLDRVADLHRGLGAWVLRIIEATSLPKNA